MIKIKLFLIAAILLLNPVYAAAISLGTGTLDMSYSTPIQYMVFPDTANGYYYVDYDGTYTLNGESWASEMFCVEDKDGDDSVHDYEFFTVDSSLDSYGVDADSYIAATWLTNWYSTQTTYAEETAKAIAQVAVWEVVLETTSGAYDLTSGTLRAINGYAGQAQDLLALLITAEANGTWDDYAHNWLLAVNPVVAGGDINLDPYQNYLVTNPNPAPEPASMLLFGTGLIGLAGIGRKKLSKSN